MKNLIISLFATMAIFNLNAQDVLISFQYFGADGIASTSHSMSEHLKTYPDAQIIEQDFMDLNTFKSFGLYDVLIERMQEGDFKMHSFKLARESIRFDPVVLQSYGQNISTETQDLVFKAKNGDRYILYDVQVKCSNGETHKLNMVAVAQINSKA
jgi:hypothetical protein